MSVFHHIPLVFTVFFPSPLPPPLMGTGIPFLCIIKYFFLFEFAGSSTKLAAIVSTFFHFGIIGLITVSPVPKPFGSNHTVVIIGIGICIEIKPTLNQRLSMRYYPSLFIICDLPHAHHTSIFENIDVSPLLKHSYPWPIVTINFRVGLERTGSAPLCHRCQPETKTEDGYVG